MRALWTSGGPGVRMMCWPPDRREGTLRGFEYPRAHGVMRFAPQNAQTSAGYILLRFVWQDPPLNEDIPATWR